MISILMLEELNVQTKQLIFLCSLYQIDQLIDLPARDIDTSATLIDLVLTNGKKNVSVVGQIRSQVEYAFT